MPNRTAALTWRRRQPRPKRSHGLGAILLVVLTLVATACGGTKSGNGSGSNKTIKIGLATVLSGPFTDLGEVDNGAVAYLKYINAQGGVNGYRFTWKAADTAYTSSGSVSAARRLAGWGAQTIIGVGTIPTLAIRPISAQLGMPIFLPGNGALYTPPKKDMFDITPDYDAMYPAMYNMGLKVSGGGPVGLVYESDDIGQPAAASVPKYANAKQLQKPALMEAAPGDVTDCTPFMAKMQKSGAKAVVLAMNTAPDACMVKAAAKLGYSPEWVGNWGITSPSYYSLLGPLFKGQHVLDYQISLSSGSKAATLYEREMKKYDPKDLNSGFSEQGWDIAAIVAQAVKKVTESGKPFTVSGLSQALNTQFHGQTVALLGGGVTFDSKQHYGTLNMATFVTTKDGGHRQVGPFKPLPNPYGTK